MSGDDEAIVALPEAGAPYPVGKLDAHRRAIRHLAISVFLFRDGRLLVQRRAAGKYHSPGQWANTCCSHPRWGEEIAACAARRLGEEVGWTVPLAECGTIEYSAPVGALHEHELVHCFVGGVHGEAPLDAFDAAEVAALEWRGLDAIEAGMTADPGAYAPWFRIYMREHRPLLERWAASQGEKRSLST